MSAAFCPGCGNAIPDREGGGWWHPECHEKASADVNRMLALRAVAHMHGYRAEKSA